MTKSAIVVAILSAPILSSAQIPSSTGWHQIPNTRQQAACPTGQLLTDVYGNTGCSSVIGAWNGGIADVKRNRLLFWGGGHGDYYGNEIYSLNLNTLTMVRLNNPSDPPGSCAYAAADGRPASRHTYNGLAYMSTEDKMYVMGGGTACPNGMEGTDTWILDLSSVLESCAPNCSSAWTRKDTTAIGGAPSDAYNGKVAAYDPATRLVFINDAFNFWKYDLNSNTYTNMNTPSTISGYLTGEIDPIRRLFILFGHGRVFHYNIDANAQTVAAGLKLPSFRRFEAPHPDIPDALVRALGTCEQKMAASAGPTDLLSLGLG